MAGGRGAARDARGGDRGDPRPLGGRAVQPLRRPLPVENARIYTLPETPPDILVSGFGPKSVELAARVGDGYVTVGPDKDAVDRFRKGGGDGKPVQGGTKVCWGPDEAECVNTVHRLWPNEALPGELAQILPQPAHFEQATRLVTEAMIAESVPCGPNVDRIVATIQEFADAGFEELYVQQIGDRQAEFFDMLGREVLRRFG